MATDPLRGRDPGDLTALDTSSQAFTRTVDALTDEELAAASLLPGWTRAHVVAHVALNGYALAGVIDGLVHRRPVAMYASDAQRDRDIEALSRATSSELPRAPPDRHHAVRRRGGPPRRVALVRAHRPASWRPRLADADGAAHPAARARDPPRRPRHGLQPGRPARTTSWSSCSTRSRVDQSASGPFRAQATDLGRSWAVGGPGVRRSRDPALRSGWWLTGRGDGAGLRAGAGELPALQPWRRAAAATP